MTLSVSARMQTIGFKVLAILLVAASVGASGAGAAPPVDLGPAIKTISVYAAVLSSDGRKLIGVANGVLDRGGARVFEFDLEADRVTSAVTLPEGGGAWAAVRADDSIYVGTYRPANVYEYRISTKMVTQLASFPDDPFIWDMKLVGRSLLIAGGGKTPLLAELNLKSGALHRFGGLGESGFVRSVSEAKGVIYAGLGPSAKLLALDRSTGEGHDILPAEYFGASSVYWSRVVEGKLYASAGSAVFSYDLATKAFRSEVADAVNDAVVPIDNVTNVFRGHGDYLYERNPSNGTLRRVASGPNDSIAAKSGGTIVKREVVGFTRDGWFVRYDLAGNLKEEVSLAGAGLEPIPSRVAALAASAGTVFVASRVLRAYSPETGFEKYHVMLGEPKAMCQEKDMLFSAHYTGAVLWGFPVSDVLGAAPLYQETYRLWSVGEGQNRPVAIICGDGFVAFGGEPDYGNYGGALNVRFEDGKTLRVDALTRGQNVNALASQGQVIFVGTAAAGGTGAKPLAVPARVIRYDVAKQRPDFDVDAGTSTVRSLVIVHDKLFYAAENGGLVVLDARTGRTIASVPGAGITHLDVWAEKVIAATARGIALIDPNTLATATIASARRPSMIAVDHKTGKLYWIEALRLMQLDLNR